MTAAYLSWWAWLEVAALEAQCLRSATLCEKLVVH
jgi:hypothetical protein